MFLSLRSSWGSSIGREFFFFPLAWRVTLTLPSSREAEPREGRSGDNPIESTPRPERFSGEEGHPDRTHQNVSTAPHAKTDCEREGAGASGVRVANQSDRSVGHRV